MSEVFVYFLECKNNTIYTGVTNDLSRRISEHIKGKGAKYTSRHGVKSILGFKSFENRSLAMKEEYRIKKKLTSANKRKLALNWMDQNKAIGNYVNYIFTLKSVRNLIKNL